jgi:hypothetical protein
MSGTEYVIYVRVDLGLNYKDTKEAVGNILASGSLSVDRNFMKEKFPDMKSGTIQILDGEDYPKISEFEMIDF